ALDALRIEAGRRAWGAELGPDESPFEAGTTFAVKLARLDDFIGKAALARLQDETLRKKLVTVVADGSDVWLWGGEALLLDGEPVGEISSAGWSDSAGRCIGLGYVRGDSAKRVHDGSPIAVDLWGEPVAAASWDLWKAPAETAR
ncbi:MAG: glycine cleavage T C-terminal barrel domain-containing protein, partial [Caldimonas sp.]